MENNELLQAMQAMMKEEIGGLRQEMATKKDITELKAEVGRVEHELTILIEDNHKDIVKLLREDYGRIEGNAAKGAKVAESYEEVRSKQNDHARAIQNHNERITVLEEKAI